MKHCVKYAKDCENRALASLSRVQIQWPDPELTSFMSFFCYRKIHTKAMIEEVFEAQRGWLNAMAFLLEFPDDSYI